MAETTEKITVNVSVVDLGKIDLLVEEGFFANRTDFVKDSIRRTLDTHGPILEQKIAKSQYVLGVVYYEPADFRKYRQEGEVLDLTIIGVLSFADDFPAQLVAETVRSCKVYGVVRASPEIKAVLAQKQPGSARP